MRKEIENIVKDGKFDTRMAISDIINSDIVEKMKNGFELTKNIKSPNFVDAVNYTSLNITDNIDYVKLASNIANNAHAAQDAMYFDNIVHNLYDTNETVSDMHTLYMIELFLLDQFNTLYSRIDYEFEWFEDTLKSRLKSFAISLPMKILNSINKYFDINAIKYYWQSMINPTDTEECRKNKLESAIAPSLNLFITDTMAGISMVMFDIIYAHFVTEITGEDFNLILQGLSPFLTDFRDELLDFTFEIVVELVLHRATIDKDIHERVKELSAELLGDDYRKEYCLF